MNRSKMMSVVSLLMLAALAIGAYQPTVAEVSNVAFDPADLQSLIYSPNERVTAVTTVQSASWSPWMSLDAPPAGYGNIRGLQIRDLAVENNRDGRLEVFAIGFDGALWHIWQTQPNNRWSPWKSLGRPTGVSELIGSSLEAVRNKDGRIEIFILGFGKASPSEESNLWHIWQEANGGWSGWKSLSQPPFQSHGFVTIAAGQKPDGGIEIFAVDQGSIDRGSGSTSSTGFWHIWQTQPNNGWSQWRSLDQPLGASFGPSFIPVSHQDGQLEQFEAFTDRDSQLSIAQQEANGDWGPWMNLGKDPAHVQLNHFVATQNQDGRIGVFATGWPSHSEPHSGELWHILQTAPNGSWGQWTSLGKPPCCPYIEYVARPVVSHNRDGRLEVFVFGSEGHVWHIWQTNSNDGWSQWEELGLPVDRSDEVLSIQDFEVGRNQDGRLELFAIGADHSLWHIYQQVASDNWESLGGELASPVSAVAWSANRLDLFALGTDNAVWHKYWDGSNWVPSLTDWEPLGGEITEAPVAVTWGPNSLDVLVRGTDNALYHKWWDGSNWGPSRTDWEFLGGELASPVSAVAWSANRLDLFALGTDSAIWHKWWDGKEWGPSLTEWEPLGAEVADPPVAIATKPNHLDVFVRGTDNVLYTKWWDGSSWQPSLTDWVPLGGDLASPVSAVAWSANRLDLFALGTDKQVWHKWWNGSSWQPSLTDWESLGGVVTEAPVAVAWAPNRLDVFVRGTDNAIWHKWWNGSSWQPSLIGWEFLGGDLASPVSAVAWSANRLDLFALGTDKQVWHKYWDGSNWVPSLTDWESLR